MEHQQSKNQEPKNQEPKNEEYWLTTSLNDMTDDQWESLCDGCAQCCAHKLQDEDTEEIIFTNVVCQYLDSNQCRCGVYQDRSIHVPDCIKITPDNAKTLAWIPESCAYKRLATGQSLPEWHPLETGDRGSTHKANMSVTGKVISEVDVNMDDLEDYSVEDDYFSRFSSK